MTNAIKTANFTSADHRKETPLDKTTRIVRRMTDDEAEVRQLKTARLRKARFESEEETVAVETTITSKRARKRR